MRALSIKREQLGVHWGRRIDVHSKRGLNNINSYENGPDLFTCYTSLEYIIPFGEAGEELMIAQRNLMKKKLWR